MIENTIENKAVFFARYMFQKVIIGDINNPNILYKVEPYSLSLIINGNNSTILSLNNISSITDEHAIWLVDTFQKEKYMGTKDQKIRYGKNFAESLQYSNGGWMVSLGLVLKCINFLISKGYYVGDGTELEYNWAVLKTDK